MKIFNFLKRNYSRKYGKGVYPFIRHPRVSTKDCATAIIKLTDFNFIFFLSTQVSRYFLSRSTSLEIQIVTLCKGAFINDVRF